MDPATLHIPCDVFPFLTCDAHKELSADHPILSAENSGCSGIREGWQRTPKAKW
jgi:hypothetical protein